MPQQPDDIRGAPSRSRPGTPNPGVPDLLGVLDARRAPGHVQLATGPRGASDGAAPHTVDIVYLGACQLHCAYCWGPAHDRRGSLTLEQINRLLPQLAAVGTRHIVNSGGETTLSPHPPGALRTAKALNLRTTVSTNGIRFARHVHLLPYIDDLGIAIDGDTSVVHNAMRAGAERYNGWSRAIEAVRLAQESAAAGRGPGSLTVRSVVAKPNVATISRLPAALVTAGIDLRRIRIKLYQVEPIGPHVAGIDFSRDWAVNESQVLAAAEMMRQTHPELEIVVQLYSETRGRYFLIGPDGEASGTDLDARGYPTEVPYGNAVADLPGALRVWREHGGHLRAQRLLSRSTQTDASWNQMLPLTA